MLRHQRFLPCQLNAAFRLASEAELSDRKIEELFGRSREFQYSRTPLVNNIDAASAFVDQYGRLFCFADPSDYDPTDYDEDCIPDLRVTDRLYAAIANRTRHTSDTADPDALELPDVDEELRLQSLLRPTSVVIRVSVEEVLETTRLSSALIELDSFIPVLMNGELTAQAKFEAAVRHLN